MSGGDPKTWDAGRYDAQHGFVWKYGEELLKLLAPQADERILDLGCGTGHLTAQIAQRGASVLGLDHDPRMIEKARAAYPQLEVQAGDALTMRFHEPFDAVFSNAALHWIQPPEVAARNIAAALKPSGRLVLEMGGHGNLRAIHGMIERVRLELGLPANPASRHVYFPSIGQYATVLEQAGLAVTWASLFSRPTVLEGGRDGLRDWMAVFADHMLDDLATQDRVRLVGECERRLEPELWEHDHWVADYRRLRMVAAKAG